MADEENLLGKGTVVVEQATHRTRLKKSGIARSLKKNKRQVPINKKKDPQKRPSYAAERSL